MKLTKAQLARLHSLERTGGRLTAAAVVKDARQRASPLHALFNWDMRHAAERWWLHRAREIIGAVTIEVTHKHAIVSAPCYVVDTTVKGDGYRNVTALKADTNAARASLVYTLEVAAGHIRRAYDLAGPLGLQREIDDLLAAVAGVQRVATTKAA